jgi:hypothetical protein
VAFRTLMKRSSQGDGQPTRGGHRPWPAITGWRPARLGSADGGGPPFPADVRNVARRLLSQLRPAVLWRDHRLFTILAALSVLPRLAAVLGFRPALLIQDSFSYLGEGLHLRPGETRPAGYSMLLWVLQPFHSLVLVTTLQHLLGIAMAAVVYGVLRHRGLPAWGSCLAAAPTLFDSREIWSESSILPDALFSVVVVFAAALLLSKRTPRPWQCALAGLLLAWASVIRGNGVPLILPVLAFLLIRKVGWKAFAAGAAAFAIPLVAYMSVFYANYGQFNITNSNGMFLWSRTTSFANCAVIKPPPDLVPLCPQNQPHGARPPAPSWSLSYALHERTPADYLWQPGSWYWTDADPGFNAYNNGLAQRFALDAITAQPLDYATVTAKELMLTFLATDKTSGYLTLHFTATPHVHQLSPYMQRALRGYGHTTRNTHPVQPWAFFMYVYQLPVYFPGIVFLLVMLAGLAGVARNWRQWGGPAALPWFLALIDLVVPVAAVEYDYRYAISAVPLACLAAGLVFIRQHRGPAAVTASSAASLPAGPADDGQITAGR